MKTIRFAENLKSLRESNKMSQQQLADMLNVNRRSISVWERGICEPNLETLSKLCEIFGETFDSLLT